MEISRINKDDSIISRSDWNSFILAQSNNRLKDFEEKANIYLKQEYESKNFFNLSLNDIFRNTILVMVLIFQELIQMNTPEEQEKRKDMSFNEIYYEYARVFMKDNRVIYVGTFLVLVSMLFMLLCINL